MVVYPLRVCSESRFSLTVYTYGKRHDSLLTPDSHTPGPEVICTETPKHEK